MDEEKPAPGWAPTVSYTPPPLRPSGAPEPPGGAPEPPTLATGAPQPPTSAPDPQPPPVAPPAAVTRAATDRRLPVVVAVVLVVALAATALYAALADRSTNDKLAKARSDLNQARAELRTAQNTAAQSTSQITDIRAQLSAAQQHLNDTQKALGTAKVANTDLKACLAGIANALQQHNSGDEKSAASTLSSITPICDRADQESNGQ